MVFSVRWDPDEAGFHTRHSNRINEIASKSEGKQASFLCRLQPGVAQMEGGSSCFNLIKKIHEGNTQQFGF